MTDLRGRFVEQIRQNGAPLSPELATAFATVPREVFVADGFLRRDGTWAMPGARDFLDLVYRDDVLVTKVAGAIPVSSSSQPSLMAIMIAALEIRPGMRILEIGAGTGYNAALLSALGAYVTSVDVQPDVADRARAALAYAGVPNATVILGDGYAGVPGEHFDRVLVTVGVAGISPWWLSQLGIVAGGGSRGDGPAEAGVVGRGFGLAGGGPASTGDRVVAAGSAPTGDRVVAAGSVSSGGGVVAAGPVSSGGGVVAAGEGLASSGGGVVAAGGGSASSSHEVISAGGGSVASAGGRVAAGGGLAVVPVEHAGMHPVLAVRAAGGAVTATVVCPSGFMSAAGPLTADHAHAHPAPAPAGSLVKFTQVAAARWDPPLDSLSYRDLWYAAGVWHRRASHAALRRDQSNLALLDQARTGGAIILPSGAVLAGGAEAERYAADAAEILDRWESAGRPPMQAWHLTLTLTDAPDAPIWVPTQWSLARTTTT